VSITPTHHPKECECKGAGVVYVSDPDYLIPQARPCHHVWDHRDFFHRADYLTKPPPTIEERERIAEQRGKLEGFRMAIEAVDQTCANLAFSTGSTDRANAFILVRRLIKSLPEPRP
jgi:hypothetical protein